MDDVSVFSLTASRLGAIATEFTSTERMTLATEFEGHFDASIPALAKASARSKASASSEQTGQVLRKSIVQTAFKDLYDLEANRLAFHERRDPSRRPTISPEYAIEADGEWIVDAAGLERGRLFEAEVELEAEAVFRFNAVVSAFLQIFEEDLTVFGVRVPGEIAQGRAINRILDKLLAGLVPLRGRAVDLVAVSAGGKEFLMPKELAAEVGSKAAAETRPVVVVGVAEQRLFWKDIRRVLFSNSRYRVFCRLSQTGLRANWTPVKLTDVLKEVAPQFESQLLGALGPSALVAMGEASTGRSDGAERATLREAARSFVHHLVEAHGLPLDEVSVEAIVEAAVDRGGSLENIDQSRAFYRAVQRDLDAALGVETTPNQALTARLTASADMAVRSASQVQGGDTTTLDSQFASPRFLDSEFVAIYW